MRFKIYVISGLGADETVFQKLDIEGCELVHIKWVSVVKGESLSGYAKRLLPQIKEENPIILGLSLGGIFALEISKLIPTRKIISLSSVVLFKEFPLHYKVAGYLRLQKIVPIHWFSKGNKLTQWFFGVSEKENRIVFNEVLKQMDGAFLKWAVNAVLKWRNEEIPENVYRIHGASDFVLPKRKRVEYNTIILNGGHLMLLEKYKEVSLAIYLILAEKILPNEIK